jgi:hypothetical protein
VCFDHLYREQLSIPLSSLFLDEAGVPQNGLSDFGYENLPGSGQPVEGNLDQAFAMISTAAVEHEAAEQTPKLGKVVQNLPQRDNYPQQESEE